jgi:hypothetical protein
MASQPRISVNKLGTYLVSSSATARRAIIRDQIRPKQAVVPQYQKANDPIRHFLSGGGTDVDGLIARINRIRNTPPRTDWQAADYRNTAKALEHFMDVCEALPTKGIRYERGHGSPPRLDICGVSVSVRPDFLLYFEKRGQPVIGALKIHFTQDKGRGLGKEGQQYVATLCREWLKAHGPEDREPLYTHCFSLDVFRKSLVSAPSSFTKRMKEIEAACLDIALLWPTLE